MAFQDYQPGGQAAHRAIVERAPRRLWQAMSCEHRCAIREVERMTREWRECDVGAPSAAEPER